MPFDGSVAQAAESESRFKLITHGVDVMPLVGQLLSQPELWNADRARTQDPASPHHGIDDTWVRWRDPAAEGNAGDPHFAVDLPAWGALPALHLIVRGLSHGRRSVPRWNPHHPNLAGRQGSDPRRQGLARRVIVVHGSPGQAGSG